jgi:phosphatidylglycerophosphate synthase
MEKEIIYISPNFLTSLKFITLSLMLFFAYNKNEAFFLIFFIASWLIDYADGALARSIDRVTELGEKLDTITDILFFITLSLSYYFFFPQFSTSVAIYFFILLAFWLFNKGFAFYKFRRIIVIHHLSLRVTFIAGGVFTLITMLTGNPNIILFFILALIAFFSVIEEFFILRKMHKHDEEIKSIFLKEALCKK